MFATKRMEATLCVLHMNTSSWVLHGCLASNKLRAMFTTPKVIDL